VDLVWTQRAVQTATIRESQMTETNGRWASIGDKELLRAYNASRSLNRVDPSVVAELRRRGFQNETSNEPFPSAGEISAQSAQNVRSASGTIAAIPETDQSWGMSIFGGVLFLAGLYFLVNPAASNNADVVNLQKLAWGQSFTISGAVFLAIALRPRR
jgi:hypothetical protein